MLLNKVLAKVPSIILRNQHSYSFASFLIILVGPFNRLFESSKALTIFKISFISSFEIVKDAIQEPCIFFSIPASIAEEAAVIPNGAKICFAIGAATFINGPASILNNATKKAPD